MSLLLRSLKKSNSDFKVYEDGKFITISFVYDKDGTVWTSLYKNETTDKYVKVEDMNEKEYQSNHKPVYEENNMKKRINSLYALAVVSELMNIYPLITYFINNLFKSKGGYT